MKNFKSFIQLDEVKTKGNRLDNKQPFGEGDAYDKDVKTSPKPHDKEAAAARAKLAALAARKAMMTNKMSQAESHQSKTTMKHIDNPNAAEKKAAKDIKPGIKGVKDRFAMLQAAKDRGALKENELDEVSLKTATSAYVKRVGQDSSSSQEKSIKTIHRIAKKHGQSGVTKAVDAADDAHGTNDPVHNPKKAFVKQVMGSVKSKVKEDIDAEILFDLYNQLDESNQEIFLNQLEEDAEVLLAFAKTIAEE